MRRNEQKGRGERFFRTACAVFVALSGFVLVGCARFSGKYEATGPAAGAASIDFRSGDKAFLTLMGTTIETNYTVDGDNITFHNVNGTNLVMTADKDGTLNGPMGMTLKKK